MLGAGGEEINHLDFLLICDSVFNSSYSIAKYWNMPVKWKYIS